MHEGAVTFSVAGGEQFVPRLFAELAIADQVGERVAAVARRRVHVLHRHDHPRRRGGRQRRHAPDGAHRSGEGGEPWRLRPRAGRGRGRGRPWPTRSGSSVPERGLRHDLRAVSIVWRRELIRFRTDRLRAITSLVQPFLFLFVLGTGLSRAGRRQHAARRSTSRRSSTPACWPCRCCSPPSSRPASIVWDREFGFLREMLVAPVSRASIVIGKCLGGATIATFQGVIFLSWPGSRTSPTTRC